MLLCPPDPPAIVEPRPAYLGSMLRDSLYLRVDGGDLPTAPQADLDVLHGYPTGSVRGPLVGGVRITLLTRSRIVGIGEEVRVIHVLEIERPGETLYVMGPKPVTGEWVDDRLASAPVPSWGAFTMGVYDGMVRPSPGVDDNFEITTYRFRTRGPHRIQWRAGSVDSNVLCIEVR